MELVYLWVEDYKNIKNQGFNFSPRFECEFKDGVLTICDKKEKDNNCKNKDYIENFFGKNINVTAIVGENGSGKSNLLNLLFNEHFIANVFFILKINNELKLYGIDLDKSIYPNNSIQEEQLVCKIFRCTNLQSGKLNSCKLVFYTPLLQNSFTDNQHNHIDKKYNLSPVSLLNDYKESDKVYENITFKNLYAIYESNIIQNAIDMMKNCQTLNLPFDIPSELTIRVNKIVNYEKFLPRYEFLRDKTPSEDSFFGYCEQRTIKNWFSNSFEDFYSKNNDDENKSLFELIKKEFGETYSIDRLISILNKTSINIDFLHKELQDIKVFLDGIKNLKKFETQGSLKLNISDIPNDFISNYNKVIKSCSAFLDFDWMPKLSSGQQTFLSQFSLFYKYLNNNDKTFLFIDEGESTLHPNWQKMYIKYIIDFFQKNIQNKKIHIIFSSHSPFILSDIPNQNIIFLKKDENTGNCINDTKDIELKTFGANIHTLLSDGFFMSDGLMGEFAKEKINNIIKNLKDKNYNHSKEEKEKLLFNIKIIGEEFLKTKLLDMFYKKFDDDFIKKQRKQELEELQQKISKELENL